MAVMSTPTDSSRDELAALRERAYGRDADILDDPVAMARLSELEEQAAAANAASIAASVARTRIPIDGGSPRRTAAEPDGEDSDPPPALTRSEGTDAAAPITPGRDGHDSPAPAAPGAVHAETDTGRTVPTLSPVAPGASAGASGHEGPAADAASDVGDDALDPDAEAEVVAAGTAPARPWWRRIPVLWAASVVAGVLVGVGLTVLVQSMEAGRVGVLQVDPEAEWPEDVWAGETDDSRAFETFYGLTVLSQPQLTGDGTQRPVPCLIVFNGVGRNPSYLGGSCGAGEFPAQASFVVGRQAPSELRDRFPVGTALQFVLDGEQVHVYARAPRIVEPTP
jgi:hypothetical protein